MNRWGKVDQDDVIRARTILLASGRRRPHEEVDAYRVLAQVSPATYLPLLAGALQRLSHDAGFGKRHVSALELCEEAVAAARAIDPAEPNRADVLYKALDSCQAQLYGRGRHTEGLAMRAEMLAVSRAQAEQAGKPVIKGLRDWAAGLSEDGRYAEAADALDELVAALLSGGPRSGTLVWTLLDRIAALHNAGRSGEALAAFEDLVAMQAAKAADDRGPMACHLYSLIGYARLLDTYGRGEQASPVRQEALALLTELADTGERKSWSDSVTSYWAVLLRFSAAESEPPAPDGPRPPSGTEPMTWTPDVKRRCSDTQAALREEVDALAPLAAEDPDRHLAELVRLHRGLTIRTAVDGASRHGLRAEQVRTLFDDGVSLAGRLARHDPAKGTRALATILIDRSTLRTAVGEFGPALDDFRQALKCLGEPG